MAKLWMALGSLAGLLGVAMAAASAHAFAARLDAAQAEAVRGAVQIQFVHALALLFCGLWVARGGAGLTHVAAGAFALGTVAFCGAVYAHAILGVRLASVAPAGGMLLMAGWLLLGVSVLLARA